MGNSTCHVDIKSFGWRLLRIERWCVTLGPVTNTLWFVKVLRFKFGASVV